MLKNMQYIEVESNCPGVSNREELYLYPLKSKKNFPPYSCVNWFCVIFERSYFCSVHLFLVPYLLQ